MVGNRDQTDKIRTRTTSSTGGFDRGCDLFSISPCPTDYASPLGYERPRPLCVGAIHDLLIFRPHFCSFWSWDVHRTAPPPPHALDFHGFLFTFCEGNIGGSKGGYHEFGGVKFSKRLKLPTDLVHHTHEVRGPCSYENTPLRRRGPRVLASYCGLWIFRLHFSTLDHFHTTILATTVQFGWET